MGIDFRVENLSKSHPVTVEGGHTPKSNYHIVFPPALVISPVSRFCQSLKGEGQYRKPDLTMASPRRVGCFPGVLIYRLSSPGLARLGRARTCAITRLTGGGLLQL